VIGTIGGFALLVPLLSALSSPAVPFGLRLLLIFLWVTSIARPHWATVALTLLVPFSSWLLVELDAPTVRYAEALVLATLSGALIAASRPRRTPLEGQAPPLWPAAVVFTTIVLASAAVTLQVMQTGTHAPWPFLRGFVVFLTRDYLVGPPGSFLGVEDAALLVEGIGLAFLVARHARDHVTRPAQLFAAMGLSGALVAIVTLNTFVTTALQATSAREFFWRLAFSRMGVHIGDVNAAGSFFGMTAVVAIALAVNDRYARAPRRPALRRACWVGAAAVMLASMWITGSRMAVLASSVGVGIVTATVGPLRSRRWSGWVVAGAAALLLVVLFSGLDPRVSAARTASRMFDMRVDFMRTGLRMIASAPVFGVGIGRYFEMSGRFMPSSIYWFYFHENAHNNFLQIGGELGLAGLAAFVWMLTAAAVRLGRGVRADRGDRLLVGACTGLGAFVLTWMTSHPMLVPEAAYPFWILLGAALARADGDAQPPLARPAPAADPPGRHVPSRAVVVAIVVATAAVAASVPLRAKREVASLDLAKQTFGFYDWEAEGTVRYRWTSRRATFFIPLNARELRIPLRAIHIGANTGPTEVSIAIGGRTFHRVDLMQDDWVFVRLRLPLLPDDEGFQRIDIITDPTWSGAAVVGRHDADVRVLGVQVGEVTALP
jgi:O-antigen ligase